MILAVVVIRGAVMVVVVVVDPRFLVGYSLNSNPNGDSTKIETPMQSRVPS